MYRPKPIDTTNIELPEALEDLVEILAEHVHDIWALGRLKDGWTLGPQRHDERKEHPDLIPYEQLGEVDKDFDRNTAKESIKAILAMGAEIHWRDHQIHHELAHSPAIPQVLPETITLLRDLWLSLEPHLQRIPPDELATFIQVFIRRGEPLLAYEYAVQARKFWPNHLRLMQIQGHALARGGASYQAIHLLSPLLDHSKGDSETRGILARAHKDLAQRSKDINTQLQHLKFAFDFTQEGYRQACDSQDTSGAIYNGINAATLSLQMDDTPNAQRLATEVLAICKDLQQQTEDQLHYWTLATMGEASLLLQDLEQAEVYYRRAYQQASDAPADVDSMRRQARVILRHLGKHRHLASQWLGEPSVALIQLPAESFGWNEQMLFAMQQSLEQWVIDHQVHQLYLQCQHPFDCLTPDFKQQTQARIHLLCASPPDAHPLFEQVDHVHVLSRQSLSDTFIQQSYLQLTGLGMAQIQANSLDAPLYSCQWSPSIGWVAQNSAEVSLPPISSGQTQIVGLLFSDVAGFSRLSDQQVARFQEYYWQLTADFIKQQDKSPVVMNTWGDALYMVHEDLSALAHFAAAWQQKLNSQDWSEQGLPTDLRTRIALHAGPAQQITDPITGHINYAGSHVAHTARLEPVTPPGQIYASREFAALYQSLGDGHYHFEYVGQTSMAKGYGVYPAYLLSE